MQAGWWCVIGGVAAATLLAAPSLPAAPRSAPAGHPVAATRPAATASDAAGRFLPGLSSGRGARPGITTTRPSMAVAIADFNGDGRLDVAVAENGGYDILLGNGDTTFQAPTFYSLPVQTLASAVTADFNGDGRADLAFLEWNAPSNHLVVLLGNGDGTFHAGSVAAVAGSQTWSLSVGDLNGDGAPDLFETVSRTSFLGNGDGTFTAVPATGAPGGMDVSKLVDLNGDGRADLVVTSEIGAPTTFQVHLGNGDGTFGAAVVNVATSSLGCEPMVGDFNHDGRPDLAFCSGQLGSILNTGGGTFAAPTYTPWPSGLSAGRRTAVGDVDGDGRLDVLVAETLPHSSPAGYAIFYGDGGGGFTASPRYTFTGATTEAEDVALPDLNSDGLADLVYAGSGELLVYAGAHYRYFTWYDRASPGMWNDNIHLVNPGNVTAYGEILLGGATTIQLNLQPGQETFFSFPAGTIGGPVTIASSLHIVATQRVEYFNSFNEVSSIPIGAAATEQLFTWYDRASPGMTGDNIHIVNPGSTTSAGTVTVGTASVPFSAPAGGETYVNFPAGTIGGPVVVQVTSGPAVLASQRVQYYGTFNEVLGQAPTGAVSESYFTWFDNASPGMWNDNVHIVNPAPSGTADITLTVPGQPPLLVSVAAGGEQVVSFPAGTINGPVHLLVTSGPAVLASQRVQCYQSFNEVLAVPPARAAAALYFNWFDTASPGMSGDNIHIVNPAASGTAAGTVTVGADTSAVSTAFSVDPGKETYVTFPAGTIGGPVVVQVTTGPHVLASQRAQYYQTFNEVPAAT